MEVVIVGAAGMVGRKLTEWLARQGRIGDTEIDRLTLVDVMPVEPPTAPRMPIVVDAADVAEPAAAERILRALPAVIFHLAATVMGQAETDFAAGYRINFDTTHSLLEAARAVGDGYRPRLVYASSTAVYGPPYPEVIPEAFFHTPLSSYGTQKAMCELLLSDYTRRGFADAIGIRLPTICVRPGAPTHGSSGFFSNIIREPLAGREVVLPVPEEIRHWFASPRAAVAYLVHAAAIDGDKVGAHRNLTMPGLSATVGDAIDALRRIAGDAVASRITRELDETMTGIAADLPRSFTVERAKALGFRADGLGLGPEESFEDIIRIHIEDDLGGDWVR